MKKKKTGLVTYTKFPGLNESDRLLVNPFKSLGYDVQNAAWDDKNINWEEFDTLILRSCWNYHLESGGFLAWLSKIKKIGIKLFNPYSIVRWNLNKTYLFDLEKKGFNIIPTKLITKNSLFNLKNIFSEFNYADLVIKPVIGASAFGIKRININDNLKPPDGDFIIQPLMEEIKNGEISLIFFGKKFSHAVLKKPKKGEFRTDYIYGGSAELTEADKKIIFQAKRIIENISGEILYARVDGIIADGKFLLMELELIEPYLYLDLYPKSAELFALRFKELDLY